jgi:hypothetical protein
MPQFAGIDGGDDRSMAFEKISERRARQRSYIRTRLVLVLHDGGPDAPAKQMQPLGRREQRGG